MTEEILPDIFKLNIPLPNNPLKSLNSYVVKGKNRNLIIDTGMNREECTGAMNAGLQDLEVDLQITDFFITHMHADHAGLISYLATPASKLYCSEADAAIINAGGGLWKAMEVFMQTGGFPKEEFYAAIRNHPGYKYRALGENSFTFMKEGDTIQVGDYRFSCVETPGHTRGHLCLYDVRKKIFISGDHILSDITPNISLWSYKINPLADYLESLDKVYNFDIDLVLPGHRRLFADHRQRIDELKLHHRFRAKDQLFAAYKFTSTNLNV